ncbi:hypothetical protein ACF0H5_011639 [Mactra antiquata]
MALYRKYPRLCTVWCFVEIVLYAGQLFGWSSILHVLKSEEFYIDLCVQDDVLVPLQIASELTNVTKFSKIDVFKNELNISDHGFTYVVDNAIENGSNVLSGVDSLGKVNYDVHSNDQFSVPESLDSANRNLTPHFTGCKEQETRLNLWFSIAICTSYIACSFMGPLLRHIGMRKFRFIFLVSYVTGSLILGFVTPATPWLICPGLCCIGVAGMALYATNIQVSFLFPNVQSTITSVFVGLYDVSTIVSYIMKVAFDSGLPRMHFYLGLSIFHLFLVGVSTIFLLPRDHISPETVTKNRKLVEKEKRYEEKEKFVMKSSGKESNALKSLFSAEYLLHVYWMCVQGLRFVTFLGFFNTYLEKKFEGNSTKENYYLGVFSYVTIGTLITAITAGMLHDCQRRKYIGTDEFRRRRLPIIVPLTVTSLMSVVITSLIFVRMEIFLNFIFITFTIYRSYLFSYEITFINDVYPLSTFPVLFGVIHSSAGLAGMLQYPLFEWYTLYPNAPDHVNIFLIILAISSLAHPLHIWIKCKKHKKETPTKSDAIEIFI